ncbi:uncharacterized protein PAC_18979 [Phialocephala subalpina]|uniref:phospholipase A2 n=1 Tax=Phialocephala subalpina TaxID=576137 RepID=A0A1L7XVP3_9HELO|nr:uncharacterized protein PAC_18979 [Phialocephala subalpina]
MHGLFLITDFKQQFDCSNARPIAHDREGMSRCLYNIVGKGLSPKAQRIVFNREGFMAKGRFDSGELEDAIKDTIADCKLENRERFKDPESPCKVFVCAILTSNAFSAALFRTYSNPQMPEESYEDCNTWEACRATSAATTFFDPITVGPMKQTFADGAVAYNNPIQLVYREAKYMWPDRMKDALLISIGTGAAPGPALEGNAISIIKALKGIVTETEKTNNDFLHDHYEMLDAGCLYRFNVLHKLANVGLEEYKEIKNVAGATQGYLNDAEMRHKYRKCLTQLRSSLTEDPTRCSPIIAQEVLSDVMHWKTPKFFGRQRELDWIHDHLENHRNHRKLLVICGLSGLGKTQLVLQYWCKHTRDYSSMLWIDATSNHTVLDSFERVANELDDFSTSKKPLDHVKGWLSRPSNQNWIMIIDNFVDLDGDFRIQELMPHCEHGAIIVTTTQSGTRKVLDAEVLDIAKIDIEAGAEILLSRLKSLESSQLKQLVLEIVADLDGVPLALKQAGAYLSFYPRLSPSVLRKYLTQLKSEYGDVMKHIPKRSEWYYEKHQSIIDTFNILRRALIKTSNNAANVLTLSAFLAPGDIPLSILQAADDVQDESMNDFYRSRTALFDGTLDQCAALDVELCTWLDKLLRNQWSSFQALTTLEDHCCAKVRWSIDGKSIISYSIHDAIRKWSQASLPDSTKGTWAALAAFRLSQCLSLDEVTILSRQKYLRHVLFAEQVLLCDESPACMKAPDGPLSLHARSAAVSFARFHQRQKNLEKSQAFLEKAIEYEKTIEGVKWPSVQCFQTLHLFGRVLWQCGEFTKALEAFENLVQACESSLGIDDGLTLTISTEARLLKMQASRTASDLTRAIQAPYQDKVTQEISIDSSVPVISLSTDHDTGIEYMDQEEYSLVQAIANLGRIDGENSEKIILSKYALAKYYGEASRWRRAVLLFKVVWRTRYQPYMHSTSEILQSAYILDPFYNYLYCSQQLGIAIKPLAREFPMALFWSQRASYDELTNLLTTQGVKSTQSSWHQLNRAIETYSEDDDKGKLIELLEDPETNIEQRSPEGFTPLHQAVLRKPLWILHQLLHRGADVEATVDNDYTALHLAAARGNVSAVESLLSWGAGVQASTNDGYTPLHLAVVTGNHAIVRLLLEAGANVNATTIKSRFTPLPISVLRVPLSQALCRLEGRTLSNSREGRSDKWLELDVKEQLATVDNIIVEHLNDIGGVIMLHTPSVPLLLPLIVSNRDHVLLQLISNGADLEAKTIHGHTVRALKFP